ncbi:MAG: ornithine carbamoyltransferase [Proteobacteria bacterium]|nr:ornithine carbamoyltransferase [Pseudomonadota bacterium]
MRHLPHLKDLSREEILDILDKAATIKANPMGYMTLLAGKSMAMLFQKTSTRTRVSFEVGMTELGGHAVFVDWATSNFVLSGIEHETEYLSRNVACIMARMFNHADLLKIVGASQVPVINGCDEKFHPCQALTDVMSMREHYKGNLEDATIAFVGVQNNVSNSLITICQKLGINLNLGTPEDDSNGESLDADVQKWLATSPKINHTTDPSEAVVGADFVYTDTWIDMQYFNDPDHEEENEIRLRKMMPYQIDKRLVEGMDCKIMHDMPIHDGFEIAANMVKDPRSIIYEQTANRLHAQKGLLWWIFAEAEIVSHEFEPVHHGH